MSGFIKVSLGAVAFAGLFAASAAQAGWSGNGEWARDDGQVRVRLSHCGGKICAVNTWTKDPSGQEKPGDRFVMSLVSTDSNHWSGSAFDPQRNLVYKMDVSVSGEELTTHGCISGSSLCQTAAWKRISN